MATGPYTGKSASGAVAAMVAQRAAMDVPALLETLGTTPLGLTQESAERRLEQVGPNEVGASGGPPGCSAWPRRGTTR